MTVTIPTELPADLYLELYDALDELPIEDVVAHVAYGRGHAAPITADIVRTGFATRPSADLRSLVTTFLALQDALLFADPDRNIPDKKKMAGLATSYALTMRLNSDEKQGRLLFTRAHPGRPDTVDAPNTLADLSPALLRVQRADLRRIRIRSVRSVDDLVPAAPPPATAELAGQPAIAVGHVPFLGTKADVQWDRVVDPDGLGQDAYTVLPVTSRLLKRVPKALDALTASGAELALLSEASLNQDLLAEWQHRLATVSDPGQLRWIMVGTGGVDVPGAPKRSTKGTTPRRPNRAVMLSNSGEVIWYQDKRLGFTLDDAQLVRYGLDSSLGTVGPLSEHIRHGTNVQVIEATAGRFAIAICEDHGHMIKTGYLCASVGVTHLLVPVIAPSIWTAGWQMTAARQLANELGISTAVVNSFAIERKTKPPEPYPSKPSPTLAVVLAPHGGKVATYGTVTEALVAGTTPAPKYAVDAITVRSHEF